MHSAVFKEVKKKMKEKEKNSEVKHALITAAIILISLVMQTFALRGLSVYRTELGTYLLIENFVINGLILSIVAIGMAIFFGLSFEDKRDKSVFWKIHYAVMLGLAFLMLIAKLYDGLDLDVKFTWIFNKAGFDVLKLEYFNGWVIVFTFVPALILLLSDLRLVRKIGIDGKEHIYAHSKILGLLRVIKKVDVGDTPDSSVIARKIKEKEVRNFGLSRERYDRPHFNDLVRVRSLGFLTWTIAKFIIGIMIGILVAENWANKFLVVRNYVDTTGIGWIGIVENYLSILWMRITGTVDIPLDFAIKGAPAFEFFSLASIFLGFLFLIWTVRLIIASYAEGHIITELKKGYDSDKLDYAGIYIVSNIATIISTWWSLSLLGVGTWVFTKETPYYVWQSMIFFLVVALGALITRFWTTAIVKAINDSDTEKDNETIVREYVAEKKSGKKVKSHHVLTALILLGILLLPTFIWLFTVNPYMQSRREAYWWNPAQHPAIKYTQWEYEVDNVERLNISAITTPNDDILRDTRIFSRDAAATNMRSQVGENWMANDPNSVNVIFKDGRELWVSPLTLVAAQYPGDMDVRRARTMLWTNSQRILAIDASTTQPVDAEKLFHLNGTVAMYYGQGGLWHDEREVYLHIPGFNEVHIDGYRGPSSYKGEPDYVYTSIWRVLRFIGNWDFAFGNFGDVQALTARDTRDRLSQVLLPNMVIDYGGGNGGQLVDDGTGHLYYLYWVNIEWDTPTEFGGYPEGDNDKIIRRFAVVLIDAYDGNLKKGYFVNRERDDYVLSFYRSYYPQWNQEIPDWLQSQLRRPEHFFNEQMNTYNFYFQENFQKWQTNEFYEPTLTSYQGDIIEEVRYIMMYLKGEKIWGGKRLVEKYNGQTRNLAGIYVAPGGKDIEKFYFVAFGDEVIIGPQTAIGVIDDMTTLTSHPNYRSWEHGNILMYAIRGELYYVIPYSSKATSSNKETILPQVVVVVNANSEKRKSGAHIIQDTTNYQEISMAATYAFQNIGRGNVTAVYGNTGVPPQVINTVTNITGGGNHTYVIVVYKDGQKIQEITLS